jgi:hypothetical protein
MINNTNTSKLRVNSASSQNYNSGAVEFTLGLDVFVLLIITKLYFWGR